MTGNHPDDPLHIETNALQHPDDMKAAIACVEICREIGHSAPLRAFVERAVAPADLREPALEDFIRDSARTYYHQSCTAKMGRDEMAVVDANLKVYGIANLRVADASSCHV